MDLKKSDIEYRDILFPKIQQTILVDGNNAVETPVDRV